MCTDVPEEKNLLPVSPGQMNKFTEIPWRGYRHSGVLSDFLRLMQFSVTYEF
jgi:hypothetical protein